MTIAIIAHGGGSQLLLRLKASWIHTKNEKEIIPLLVSLELDKCFKANIKDKKHIFIESAAR